MPLPLLLLGTLLLSQPTPSPPPPSPPPQYCEVRILRDYDFQFSYFAVFRLQPGCTLGRARIRKSSTLSTVAQSHPYQPIFPKQGAWELRDTGTTVPFGSRWTLNTWEWQYYDDSADRWVPMKSARAEPRVRGGT